ncbi:MAG TPA: RNA polymerase sigma factor [Verrucomicrobiae bacterium]|nr:RNA polymerase sigma factor [Verrucomicrobiae bacterium]
MQPDERNAIWLRLMEQYRAALWRLVQSYEADSGGREDLLQEIALGLWQAIPSFRGDSSERTWLYRIAHNTAISASVSRKRRSSREVELPESAEPRSTSELPDRALVRQEQREAMLAAIRELPAIDRQLIVLHLEGLSYREIEQIAGMSEGAIATRLSRIRDRLTATVRGKEKCR